MRAPAGLVAVGAALASLTITSCNDNDDTRLTAKVLTVDAAQVCVEAFPGDLKGYEEYSTCYPYSPGDRERLEPDTCISARFPWPGAKNRAERPIYEVKVMDSADCGQ